jgi:hypothetical protein
MSNRGSDRRQIERRIGEKRRNQKVPVESDQRSGEDRRDTERRSGIDRRDV